MTTCFFCQNLLSDYIEKLLPKARNAEVKGHLESCAQCRKSYEDMLSVEKLLSNLEPRHVNQDLALRMMEACETTNENRRWAIRIVASLAVVFLLLSGVNFAFPGSIPLLSDVLPFGSEAQAKFVRYYPLYHNAEEILEEQGAVIEKREVFSGSLWEEGGLSPEEFERVFQLKAPREDTK